MIEPTTNRYTKDKQKSLGAFYTPDLLASCLSKILISLVKPNKSKPFVVVDPATGDSILLRHFAENWFAEFPIKFVGIDIEEAPISNSISSFSQDNSCFIQSDALYPLNESDPNIGWANILSNVKAHQIDCFICNPPWGADINDYSSLSDNFLVAQGQFDIYDLFIETIVNHLSANGLYGIIVPDSIYAKEHLPIRKILLCETTIKYIINLGEGFFDGVNMSTSLIIGKKVKPNARTAIKCIHLSKSIREEVLADKIDLFSWIMKKSQSIKQSLMRDADFSFVHNLQRKENALFTYLDSLPKIGEYTESCRGVELSKKGVVVKCPKCNKWFPQPNSNTAYRCPGCSSFLDLNCLETATIIADQKKNNTVPFLSGEDIYRFTTMPKSYIELGFNGVNYKSPHFYLSPKILIRKTGVGITAAIDYENCYVNQVVYILRTLNSSPKAITNEVILAILNSRVITYFIIKKYGTDSWKTHPYLTQSMVADLPFPKLDLSNIDVLNILSNITDIIRTYTQSVIKTITMGMDAKLESLVAKLFNLNIKDYKVIFDAIRNAQPLIPFTRLLNINEKKVFEYGV